MSLKEHALTELEFLLSSEDEMDKAMAKHVLELIEVFSKEGHSGFSAGYAASLFYRIARFLPVGPLTGEASEWAPVDECGLIQNRRCSAVFKDGLTEKAFYVEGFYFVDPDGDTYTTGASHAPVKFPFSPVQKKIKLNRLERFILNRFHRFHSVVVWYKGPFAEKVR